MPSCHAAPWAEVYTDTICEYGYAKELANYGEYSGDPPEDFVYEHLDGGSDMA